MNRRLESAAEKMGFTKSALIRMLIRSFIKHLEERGRISMPLQWKDDVVDGAVRLDRVAEPISEYPAKKKK